MKKVVVLLSGCGVYDGAEIHESVLTLLALDRAGANWSCAAPDIPQLHVIDHQRGEVAQGEARNVRTEAARIARGPVLDVAEVDPNDFDAIILPGGYGAAKNLSSFAIDGTHLQVEEGTANLLRRFRAAGKPMGFLCIAPAIAARLFGEEGILFTIGNNPEEAKALVAHGGVHRDCPVDEIIVDDRLNIVCTPAYQLAKRIGEAERGITRLVEEVLARA